MFTWARVPARAWCDDLTRVSPPHENLSHAELWWEPGFPWAPVQRWMLYTLTPRHGIDKALEVDEYLAMEYPCACAYEWGRVVAETVYCPRCQGNRAKAWRDIHNAWTDRRLFAQPLFVIQGYAGGHRTAYTPDEATRAAGLGQPTRPPALGALPYAEWDNRSLGRLMAFDLAQSRYTALKTARAADRSAMERAARAAQQLYLAESFDAIQESTPSGLVEDLPRDPTLRPVDVSALDAKYIETGHI